MSEDTKVYVRVIEKQPGCYLVQRFSKAKNRQHLPFTIPRKANLTKSFLEKLPFILGQTLVFDSKLPGFGVRLGKRSKVFFVQATLNGKEIRRTIGPSHLYTPEDARRRGSVLLQQIREGLDPREEKRKAAAKALSKRITLAAAFKSHIDNGKLRFNTSRDYWRVVERCFKPWMSLLVSEITKGLVLERYEEIKRKSGHRYADYAMQILKASIARVCREFLGDGPLLIENPVSIIRGRKAPPIRRTRIINDGDLGPWLRTLDNFRGKKEQPCLEIGADFLELVLFTGLRRSEAARLRLEDIDPKQRILTVPKTKNGRPHSLPLTDHLCSILKRRMKFATELGSIWIFPSLKKAGCPISEPRFIIDPVKKKSGIEFFTHDLRRTFATAAEKLDISYSVSKRLLNHTTNGDVTLGYQIITVKRLQEPMEKITAHFLAQKAGAREFKKLVSA